MCTVKFELQKIKIAWNNPIQIYLTVQQPHKIEGFLFRDKDLPYEQEINSRTLN